MPKDTDSESFIDNLTAGFGDAVADIRHKVVEEPWYGRETTTDSPYAEQGLPKTFEEYVEQNESPQSEQTQDKGQEQQLER